MSVPVDKADEASKNLASQLMREYGERLIRGPGDAPEQQTEWKKMVEELQSKFPADPSGAKSEFLKQLDGYLDPGIRFRFVNILMMDDYNQDNNKAMFLRRNNLARFAFGYYFTSSVPQNLQDKLDGLDRFDPTYFDNIINLIPDDLLQHFSMVGIDADGNDLSKMLVFNYLSTLAIPHYTSTNVDAQFLKAILGKVGKTDEEGYDIIKVKADTLRSNLNDDKKLDPSQREERLRLISEGEEKAKKFFKGMQKANINGQVEKIKDKYKRLKDKELPPISTPDVREAKIEEFKRKYPPLTPQSSVVRDISSSRIDEAKQPSISKETTPNDIRSGASSRWQNFLTAVATGWQTITGGIKSGWSALTSISSKSSPETTSSSEQKTVQTGEPPKKSRWTAFTESVSSSVRSLFNRGGSETAPTTPPPETKTANNTTGSSQSRDRQIVDSTNPELESKLILFNKIIEVDINFMKDNASGISTFRANETAEFFKDMNALADLKKTYTSTKDQRSITMLEDRIALKINEAIKEINIKIASSQSYDEVAQLTSRKELLTEVSNTLAEKRKQNQSLNGHDSTNLVATEPVNVQKPFVGDYKHLNSTQFNETVLREITDKLLKDVASLKNQMNEKTNKNSELKDKLLQLYTNINALNDRVNKHYDLNDTQKQKYLDKNSVPSIIQGRIGEMKAQTTEMMQEIQKEEKKQNGKELQIHYHYQVEHLVS